MTNDRSDDSQRLNHIIAAYLEAVETGHLPDRDQLLAKHPDLAEELRSFFAEHDRMRAATGTQEEATLPSATTGEEATLPPLDVQEDAEGTLAQQVTQPGQLVGDVPYQSPESTRDGATVDGRSDIYSLGATLYALLTSKAPFESDSLPELAMVRTAEPARPSTFQMAINELFEDAVMRMLSKEPDDRLQTAREMMHELDRIGRYNKLEADWSGWVD